MTPESKPPGRLRRIAVRVVLAIIIVPALLTLLFAVVPIPITPLMMIRATEGLGIKKNWVALRDIAIELPHSVIVAEDATFCTHYGFEPEALQKAWDNNERGGRLRGGRSERLQCRHARCRRCNCLNARMP